METSQKVDQFCNRQFYDLIESDSRYFVSQGGTRSGKTYAICQYIIYLLTTRKDPIVVDVIRKTLPALKASIMRDFFSIAESTGVYFNRL
jgi:phage terminase large subunit